MKAENKLHFGVSILELTLPDIAPRQDEITALFMSLKSEEEGLARSNQLGWHSKDDLHVRDNSILKWLTQCIVQTGDKLIRHADHLGNDVPVLLTSMWVNINETGAWNAPHSHLPCEWSGCLYIDVNENPGPAESGIHPGDILFLDPVAVGAPYRKHSVVGYTPSVGKLFLFPGYLTHMVAPHQDEKPRISIAFNFRVNPEQLGNSG
jgi:uncharacterized protein (TIGR02466 family)